MHELDAYTKLGSTGSSSVVRTRSAIREMGFSELVSE